MIGMIVGILVELGPMIWPGMNPGMSMGGGTWGPGGFWGGGGVAFMSSAGKLSLWLDGSRRRRHGSGVAFPTGSIIEGK